MRKLKTLIVFFIFLEGCTTITSPIPENYNGPLAKIKDSAKVHSVSKADFFYLSHVDEKQIEDSRTRTRQVNYGRGLAIDPIIVERMVPAQLASFSIVGRTEYGAPILALTNTVYEVSGEVRFSPEKDKTYLINGELGENYSAVWIEDAETKTVVGKKIEINGSAKLGFFQK